MKKPKIEVLTKQQIERRNKRFAKMTPRQKRVAIAKDVLAMLAAEKFVAEPGCYIDMGRRYQNALELPRARQQALVLAAPVCNVCAVGAAFASRIRLGNQIGLNDDIHEELYPLFGHDQVIMMEDAFEGWARGGSPKPRAFYKRYPDPTKRLAAIFKNVVKNGNFRL